MTEPPKDDAAPGATGAGVQVSNVTLDCTDTPTPEGTSLAAWLALGSIREGNAWVTPERNTEGEITGHAIRPDKGTKTSRTGSKRGLTLKWPLPPYAGSTPENPIVIVEGASDAAAGVGLSLDIVGRHSAHGGKALLAALLKGRHVCIISENDSGAGQRGAVSIADALSGVCASVRIIDPPKGIKDLRLWVAAGATRESILEAASVAPLHDSSKSGDSLLPPGSDRAILVRLADVTPQPVEWLWQDRIPVGKITIVQGDPKQGKSLLTVEIAARVSTGRPFPNEPDTPREPGGVVLLNAEDDLADTVRPRLDAAGADVSRVTALSGVDRSKARGGSGWFTLADIGPLEEAILATPDCRVVILDPVSAYEGKIDGHRNGEVRGLLGPLAALAAKHRVAIILVTHLNKGGSGGKAIYRATGSLAWNAAARAIFIVGPDPADPERRVVLPVGGNLARDPSGLAFRIVGNVPRVEWLSGPVNLSAEDLVRPEPEGSGRESREGEATEWLRLALADGPIPATEVRERADADGIKWRTIERAKAALGIVPTREGFGDSGRWVWELPAP